MYGKNHIIEHQYASSISDHRFLDDPTKKMRNPY